VQGRGRTPSEGLAFFSTFFAVVGVLVGKALEVRGFANSSAFPEKLVHPARSGQPFSPLACFLQEDAPNTAIDFCEFFFQSFFIPLVVGSHSSLMYNTRIHFSNWADIISCKTRSKIIFAFLRLRINRCFSVFPPHGLYRP